MPLLQEWRVGETGLAAIWRADEPEEFFYGKTGIDTAIGNNKKRLEHLAGRYLLRYLQHDFPLQTIKRDEHNKPHLPDREYYFSISHSWPYIAAVVDARQDTGIDIQVWSPRIMDIKTKFLTDAELKWCHNQHEMVTLAWCSKEAIYKWHGRKGVSFKNHLPISSIKQSDEGYDVVIEFQLAPVPHTVLLKGIIDADFACVWVLHAGV
jgi:phosphopantetheinyl transferase